MIIDILFHTGNIVVDLLTTWRNDFAILMQHIGQLSLALNGTLTVIYYLCVSYLHTISHSAESVCVCVGAYDV